MTTTKCHQSGINGGVYRGVVRTEEIQGQPNAEPDGGSQSGIHDLGRRFAAQALKKYSGEDLCCRNYAAKGQKSCGEHFSLRDDA